MTTTLWGLFVSSFISSSILPGGSEAALAYVAQRHVYTTMTLLSVATLGNTLGGLTTWGLGWIFARKFSPQGIQKNQHKHAITRIKKWGSPILLLSWLPIIGDPLCFAAGWLGIRFLPSLFFIFIGKMIRYSIVLGVVDILL